MIINHLWYVICYMFRALYFNGVSFMDEFVRKARLFGILVECPFEDSLPHCPLGRLRSNDLHAIERWTFHELSQEELSSLLDAHDQCVCFRESNRFSECISL